MTDTTAPITLQLLEAPASPLAPEAARAWLANDLPRWLDALKSAAYAGKDATDAGAMAACVLIDDLGALITACAAALASRESVELLGAIDREESRKVLADLLHLLLTREADERAIFEPENPALMISARLASLG